MTLRRISTITGLVVLLFTGLAGCSLGDKKEEIDPPKNVVYQSDLPNDTDLTANQSENKVNTELYLIDKYGYVVPSSIQLPDTTSVAKQALEYLVKDGPVSELLPNGFQAVLPAETVVKSIDVQKGVAVVDFSKEFNTYEPENENRVLQSVVWTLTQFDSVNQVIVKVEGKQLQEMPQNHTAINGALTRNIGINIEENQVADVMNTHPITVFFVKTEKKHSYFVPVTRRVDNAESNAVVTVVKELVSGPKVGSNLTTDFVKDLALLDAPIIQDGVASLNFNENLFDEEKKVSNKLMQSLVLSLTEQAGIKKVAVTVNGSKEILDENGEPLSTPVSRPNKVNTGSY